MRKKDDLKEQRIKDAVVKITLEEGFAKTSIAKIAKQAQVSPATVYIYYENKDDMMQEIYMEYTNEMYQDIVEDVQMTMSGEQMIENMIRNYYAFVTENTEVYSFIEQFMGCPAMMQTCDEKMGICQVYSLTERMKQLRLIKDYSVENITAVILFPVKAIALDKSSSKQEKEVRLSELIRMIQSILLV